MSAPRCRRVVDDGVVFLLTYVAYALLHANRKAFCNLKPTISRVWTPESQNESLPTLFPPEKWNRRARLFDSDNDAAVFLGVLDSLFMFSYALGLYVSGWLGDRFSHRKVLFFGLLLSSLIIFLFGVVTEWAQFYDRFIYCILWLTNGLSQSTVWPSAVAILNSRLGNFRGFILGTWSSCASAGNIISDLLVGLLVPFGYHYGFLVPCVVMFMFSFTLYFGLLDTPTPPENPHTPGIIAVHEDNDDSAEEKQLIQTSSPMHRNISFWRVFFVSGVMLSSLAYACIKLVNYALFFWLTFYLTSDFGWSNSDASTFSVWYDVGGILGGIVAGLLSDLLVRHMSRNSVILLFSLLAVPALLGYRHTPPSPAWANALVMAVAGLLVGGPAVLISTVVIRELSESAELRGGRTQATIAGIIDGTGSLGASLGQIFIPYLAFRFGWSSAFYLFIICMILTCICVLPLWIKTRVEENQRPSSEMINTIQSRS
ncbi:Sugar phosphate exchanger 3 [Fasciola gigantica]|uniref:Sugar phosphate exchanger 3 n=1 Tax=Fasciola gigantica TaxID=46835 RepID=A0A504YDI5_FASGI|nr:Sugar phosphate exchanger 3 [Fasciola gigantica]